MCPPTPTPPPRHHHHQQHPHAASLLFEDHRTALQRRTALGIVLKILFSKPQTSQLAKWSPLLAHSSRTTAEEARGSSNGLFSSVVPPSPTEFRHCSWAPSWACLGALTLLVSQSPLRLPGFQLWKRKFSCLANVYCCTPSPPRAFVHLFLLPEMTCPTFCP